MQMIGITGGIGSGKSTIAKELAKHGFTVYDCDAEAKRIIKQNKEVRQAIIDLLGEEAFKKDNRRRTKATYNTAYVAKRVFSEPELLTQLNAIVHPAVLEDIRQKHPDFVESAILYESGFNALCDKIIVVEAPEELRIARTIHRDYHDQATTENINKVRARINAQQTHQGDLLIMNDGSTPVPDLVRKITIWM